MLKSLMFAAILLVTGFVFAAPPSKEPTSHAGIPVSDFVTISWADICGGSVTSDPLEIGFDGAATAATTCAYSVPAGKVFVLTDVEWIGESTAKAADAGKSMEVHIWITEDELGNSSHHVYHSRVDLDDSGVVTVTDHFSLGTPVKFGLIPVISFGFSSPQGQGSVSMKLRGYYVPSP